MIDFCQVCRDEKYSDWAEAMQIDFQNSEITYEEVLELFFKNHDCFFGSTKRQYMSAIFYHDESQRIVAEGALKRLASRRKVATVIEPSTDFYQVISL